MSFVSVSRHFSRCVTGACFLWATAAVASLTSEELAEFSSALHQAKVSGQLTMGGTINDLSPRLQDLLYIASGLPKEKIVELKGNTATSLQNVWHAVGDTVTELPAQENDVMLSGLCVQFTPENGHPGQIVEDFCTYDQSGSILIPYYLEEGADALPADIKEQNALRNIFFLPLPKEGLKKAHLSFSAWGSMWWHFQETSAWLYHVHSLGARFAKTKVTGVEAAQAPVEHFMGLMKKKANVFMAKVAGMSWEDNRALGAAFCVLSNVSAKLPFIENLVPTIQAFVEEAKRAVEMCLQPSCVPTSYTDGQPSVVFPHVLSQAASDSLGFPNGISCYQQGEENCFALSIGGATERTLNNGETSTLFYNAEIETNLSVLIRAQKLESILRYAGRAVDTPYELLGENPDDASFATYIAGIAAQVQELLDEALGAVEGAFLEAEKAAYTVAMKGIEREYDEKYDPSWASLLR